MASSSELREGFEPTNQPTHSNGEWGMSRRTLLSAGAILGLAAITQPTERAFAWSSWTNITSEALKKVGMGDCVHEDLVQIAYARMLRRHAADIQNPNTLINPWAGAIQVDDARYATIAGDKVDIGKGKTFADGADLATRLFRENLAYLRIGSFWNDAAANTLADFAYSCYYAESIPKFSGPNRYEGAWDVGQHIWETNQQNESQTLNLSDALVQFTMNDRNNFIHGMLSSTADHSSHLKQTEIKQFALQWLGVAYEYARTGEVKATSDVTLEQAEKIFKGFIDTYGQLDNDAHNMRLSLKASDTEATQKLPHRRLRLRALGMACHTMEDFWCPAHTCRTYHDNGSIPKYSILAFSNYKLQNGSKAPLFGYHIPFDCYAISDLSNSTDWREALTRGKGAYKGTEKLANVLDDSMACLEDAPTYFNTLGMNETIDCITQLFEYLFQDTPWDNVVRNWVATTVLNTYLNPNTGQSYICDAGRRSLHTPTYIIAPIQATKRAYKKMGLASKHSDMRAAAKSYDAWQRGAHSFYSGKLNTAKSKYIDPGHEGSSIWTDSEGEHRLVDLVDKINASYSGLDAEKQEALLTKIGCSGCHGLVSALSQIEGMLQEFNIDLRGSLRPDSDEILAKLKSTRTFFESGLNDQDSKGNLQGASSPSLMAASIAYADEGVESYTTADMALEDYVQLDDGSYLIAVRDMDSLATCIMTVPADAEGVAKLEENLANLTITYVLETEFEDDPDYCYIVTAIDYTDMEEDVYLVTGTVKTVSSDEKSLVLDMNGIRDLELSVPEDASDIPEQGDYICARCSVSNTTPELVGFDALDDPGTLKSITGPVGMISGSSMWILANANDADDGYRDYVQVSFGTADVFEMPREGYVATVHYHDEAYGETTDVDEGALAGAAVAGGFTDVTSQSDEDDLNDSASTPGYIEAGEDYGKLNYGNEVIHVANVIEGTNEQPEDTPPSGGDTPVQPTPGPDDSGGSESGSGSGSRSGTTKPTSNAKGSSATAAKTADPLAGLNGLISTAAVAGAALAAYSARRVANEQRKSGEE